MEAASGPASGPLGGMGIMGTRAKKNRRFERQMQKQHQQQMVNIDPSKLPKVMCGKCGSEYMKQAFKARRIPAFMSKSGRDELLFHAVFLCAACGAPIKGAQGQESETEKQDAKG